MNQIMIGNALGCFVIAGPIPTDLALTRGPVHGSHRAKQSAKRSGAMIVTQLVTDGRADQAATRECDRTVSQDLVVTGCWTMRCFQIVSTPVT